jgi:hypothetical protein
MKNTKVTYMYRDGGNYKTTTDIVLSGTIPESDKTEILSTFGEGGFIPHKLGLPHLSPVLDDSPEATAAAIDGAETDEEAETIEELDHPFHEILAIEDTDESPTAEMTATVFHKKTMTQE